MPDMKRGNAEEVAEYLTKKYGDALAPEFVQFIAAQVANPENLPTKPLESITFREEANVIVAHCFRNTVLEDYHTEGVPINDAKMKSLMIEASRKLSWWLNCKHYLTSDGDEALYRYAVRVYETKYTSNWEK